MAARDYLGLNDLRAGLGKKLLAEFIGVLFIILIGCGSTVGGWLDDPDKENPPTIFRISFAFGFAVAAVVEAFGHVSGGHVNPAITLAMLLVRRINLIPAFLYIAAQLLGAVAGAAILYAVAPIDPLQPAIGQNIISDKLSPAQALGVEWLISFLLVSVVFSLTDAAKTDSGRGSVALAVGATVTVAHLFSIPFTSTSLNPARAFGPAVITGTWTNQWVFWLGDVAGAVLAAIMYVAFFQADEEGNPISRLKWTMTGTTSGKQHISDVEIATKENHGNTVSMETLTVRHKTDS